MTFSEYAGTAIVPTLSRLVLATAFITAGYNKVFRTSDHFNAEQATILKNMGVTVVQVPAVTLVTPSPVGDNAEMVLVQAAYRPQDQPAASTSPAAGSATTHPVITNMLSPGMYRATAMYHIAVMIDNQKWRLQPVYVKWLTWAAAYTELVGGFMLLVGLFSRFWGLGLACVMGTAFYMTSMGQNEAHKHLMDFFTWGLDLSHFNTLFTQLGLFVLAFGVMLTGAGPLSLDRLLFGGSRKPVNPPPPPPDRPNRLEPIGTSLRR